MLILLRNVIMNSVWKLEIISVIYKHCVSRRFLISVNSTISAVSLFNLVTQINYINLIEPKESLKFCIDQVYIDEPKQSSCRIKFPFLKTLTHLVSFVILFYFCLALLIMETIWTGNWIPNQLWKGDKSSAGSIKTCLTVSQIYIMVKLYFTYMMKVLFCGQYSSAPWNIVVIYKNIGTKYTKSEQRRHKSNTISSAHHFTSNDALRKCKNHLKRFSLTCFRVFWALGSFEEAGLKWGPNTANHG